MFLHRTRVDSWNVVEGWADIKVQQTQGLAGRGRHCLFASRAPPSTPPRQSSQSSKQSAAAQSRRQPVILWFLEDAAMKVRDTSSCLPLLLFSQAKNPILWAICQSPPHRRTWIVALHSAQTSKLGCGILVEWAYGPDGESICDGEFENCQISRGPSNLHSWHGT